MTGNLAFVAPVERMNTEVFTEETTIPSAVCWALFYVIYAYNLLNLFDNLMGLTGVGVEVEQSPSPSTEEETEVRRCKIACCYSVAKSCLFATPWTVA